MSIYQTLRQAKTQPTHGKGWPPAEEVVECSGSARHRVSPGREDGENKVRRVGLRGFSGEGRLERNSETLLAAFNYGDTLICNKECTAAAFFLCEWAPRAVDVLGPNDEIALDIRVSYAHALYEEPRASQDDLIEALAIIEDVETRQRRIYGDSHPFTRNTQELLEGARMRLEDVDAGSIGGV